MVQNGGATGLDEPRLRMPQDMLSYFSQRVNHATGHAELQVVAELRRMESSMNAIADKVRRVEMLLSQKDKAKGGEAVMQDKLERLLTKMEQKREQELHTLKRDLHHTIIVHNHNADLMADHKAAIATIHAAIEEPQEDKPSLAQVHTKQMYEHLAQIAVTLEESAQQEIDVNDLLERGEGILQRVGKTLAVSASMYHHPPSMPPGPVPGSAMPPYGPPEAYLGHSEMLHYNAHQYYGPHPHFSPPMQYPPHHLMMR